MRSLARWLVGVVIVLDIVFAVLFFSGGWSTLRAQSEGTQATDDAATQATDDTTSWTAEALARVGRELAERSREIERRELELEELMRGGEVLRRAGLAPAETPTPTAAENPAQEQVQPAAATPTVSDDKRIAYFAQLQKTYENMEPETAAQALGALAARDKDAVIQLMLGWNPRVSGAVLDALTVTNPELAADLSYGIWLLSGKNKR